MEVVPNFLQPVGWETHSFPDMSDRAQGLIKKQVLEGSDLLVAIFRYRIGTPQVQLEEERSRR